MPLYDFLTLYVLAGLWMFAGSAGALVPAHRADRAWRSMNLTSAGKRRIPLILQGSVCSPGQQLGLMQSG
jgi:hypothetical protein